MRNGDVTSRTLWVALAAAAVAAEAWTQEPLTLARPSIAFVNVSVVPMDSDRVLTNQTVIVQGERIAALGPTGRSAVPRGARRIEGRGKYLMPGLIDMHVHLRNIGDFLLYVAHGVTTVRNMSGFAYHLRWRDSVAAGLLLGPALYTASNLVDGDSAFSEGSLVVRSRTGAERTVRAIAREGYDFVKVYVRINRDAYDGVIEAGRAHGIRIVGHVPWPVGMPHALAMRQASIEHAENIYQTWFGSKVDTTRVPAMASAVREAGIAVCPTLTVFRSIVLKAQAASILDSLNAQPEWRYVEPSVLATWRQDAREFADGDAVSREALRRRFEAEYRFFQRITRALRDAGATVLAGTDAPSPFALPGRQLVEELEIYQRVGFSPFEALRSATRDAARFLDPRGSFGTVAVGQRADLLLVDANPLIDVGHTRQIGGVMVRGQWLPKPELQASLDQMAAAYEAAGWRQGGYAKGGYERLQTRLTRLLAELSRTALTRAPPPLTHPPPR